jgi:SNF2 family DNA or RNA helicase
LDHPSLARLRELLQEAGELSDYDETAEVRVSRYDVNLLDDLDELADHVDIAASQQEFIARLKQMASGDFRLETLQSPKTLHADLRDYQLDGFQWLAFLWQNGIGGVLADDMGLGKTVEALALIAHARRGRGFETSSPDGDDSSTGAPLSSVEPAKTSVEPVETPVEQRSARSRVETRTPVEPARTSVEPVETTGAPFLVVAPSSVVSNWLSEAHRFTPSLKTVALTATRNRDGVPMKRAIQGADIVVTSYAIFRMDADAFASQRWAGLLLDEAQFLKNRATKANKLARKLRTPFKLAITGTPMENSLMELWAIFAIVAPGLLGSAERFNTTYAKPIAEESATGGRSEQLTRLRHRIRPLLMRRTKELVAAELPSRTERVLEVELEGAHRTIYDTFLQRERKRMLGMLGDFELNRFAVFRSLTLLRRMALDASLVDSEYEGSPSSKLDVLFEQLDDVLGSGHRALIFSQFTSYLHKVAERCQQAGLAYSYLDGHTTHRAAVIDEFKNGSNPLFLISLKAGGFGLNLTEADYVFLLDPWWNPATENQAIDRTHRIGQDKPVIVTRLVAKNTIEEKVMALKERKAKLFDAVLDDDGTFSNSLTAEDIRSLLE